MFQECTGDLLGSDFILNLSKFKNDLEPAHFFTCMYEGFVLGTWAHLALSHHCHCISLVTSKSWWSLSITANGLCGLLTLQGVPCWPPTTTRLAHCAMIRASGNFLTCSTVAAVNIRSLALLTLIFRYFCCDVLLHMSSWSALFLYLYFNICYTDMFTLNFIFNTTRNLCKYI